jgi:lipid-A-disaccharide synthase
VTDAVRSVFVVAGEESGDQLGAALIRALRARLGPGARFAGVGGERMRAEGVASLFPLADIAVMGLDAVLARLPTLIARIRATAAAAVAAAPDVVVIVDSPDFTHRVARRIRRAARGIPIVGYVSPSVWAWRPGRARTMAAYVDHLMAILPFEPAVHARLGGPPCTYVGHPLLDRLDRLRPAEGERAPLGTAAPVLLVLPGSRSSEIGRLTEIFGATVARLTERIGPVEVVLPAVPHLAAEIGERVGRWPLRPTIVTSEEAKLAAFRRAHAALAASGTVTLELAVSGVPMAVAYRLDGAYRLVRRLNTVLPIVRVSSMVLPNIVLGDNAVPEFLEEAVEPDGLSATLAALLREGPERERQLAAFARLDEAMRLPCGGSPSERAADVVVAVAARGRRAA